MKNASAAKDKKRIKVTLVKGLRGAIHKHRESVIGLGLRYRQHTVEVEDTPWIVVRLERRGDGLHVVLNDGDEADVDPASLRVGRDDVPYCAVKGGQFEARLSRAAAHQLLAMVDVDATSGAEELRLGGRAYPLKRTA